MTAYSVTGFGRSGSMSNFFMADFTVAMSS